MALYSSLNRCIVPLPHHLAQLNISLLNFTHSELLKFYLSGYHWALEYLVPILYSARVRLPARADAMFKLSHLVINQYILELSNCCKIALLVKHAGTLIEASAARFFFCGHLIFDT